VEQEQDSVYIEKVLGGERNAYAFLVDRYKTMVFTLALQITRSREEAEEVAQDTFVKAYHSLKNFKGKAKFSSWLYRIAYNTTISNLRGKEKMGISIDRTDLHESLSEDDGMDHESLSEAERREYLQIALDSLDADEKCLVIWYYYEERALEEIAQIAGLTKTNAKVRLFRARKKMLTVLERYLKSEKYSLL